MIEYQVAEYGGYTTTTYVYDDAGNRVEETTSGQTSYYLTDTQNPTGYAEPIEVRVGSATTSPSETYMLGVNGPIAQIAAGATPQYFTLDGHNSTRQLTSTSGSVTVNYNYDAFGGQVAGTNVRNGNSIFLYAGDAVYDPASGLYMNGDGERDRGGLENFSFIQSDPTGSFAPGDIGNANLYLYVGGNPVNLTDPTGRDGTAGEEVATTGIGAGLIARLGLAVARLYIQAGITILKIVEFAPAIYGGLAIGELAVEALKSIAQHLQNAKDLKIPLNAANDVRGNAIEDAALTGEEDSGALSHTFPSIDYFKDGFGLSIKSHAVGTKDGLISAIRGDLNDISNIENETLTGKMRDGSRLVINPGDITTKGLLVAVPRDDASVVYEQGFLEEVQSLSDEFETAIKVVSVEGWE